MAFSTAASPPSASASLSISALNCKHPCLHTIAIPPPHHPWNKPPPTGIGTFFKLTRPPASSIPCLPRPDPSKLHHPQLQPRHLLRVAGVIGLSTIVSKLLGLLRETLLAAVFGVGPIVTAFNYSSILPGFFMVIIGGVNGPLHITVLAFLSKHRGREGQRQLEKVSTFVGLMCSGLGLVLFLLAGPIIDATAPGLLKQELKHGLITRDLAVLQLKIMAPCAFLAGLIGIGFGSLSAAGVHGLASLSPSLSSISILIAVLVHITRFGFQAASCQNVTAGAMSLAIGATFGALAQWLWQVKAQHDVGLSFLKIHLANPFQDKDLHEVLVVLLPAIVGSGMLQIATFTDLYFASFIPGAAAGLGYANFLVMAPIGILSSSILLPLLPVFAQLAEPSNWTELKEQVGRGLFLLLAATLPLSAIMVILSRPMVEIVLQHFAFDAVASALVSSLVVCYIIGSTFYLARDLLVRVFYALGDAHVPFYTSVAAIIANALLDWMLVRVTGLGPNGLVLATTVVNMASAVALLISLSRKLGGLPLRQWFCSSLTMVGAAAFSGIITQFSYKWWLNSFPISRALWIAKIWSVMFASAIGLISFYLILYITTGSEIMSLVKLPELHRNDSLVN